MYTYNWTNDTFYDVVLSRHKRDTTNTSSSSSSEEDLFSESNKLAMYVVIPIMFLVYGGCACIYCCYKCRQYVQENNPKQIFKKFLGKEEKEEEKDEDNEDDHLKTERSSSGREDALKSLPPSVSSSPGPDTDVSYVDFDDAAMSTPGLGYPIRHNVDKTGSISVLGTVNHEEVDRTKPSGSDSGIQGDSNLTDMSGTLSSSKFVIESVPTAAPLINSTPQVQTAAAMSYTAAPVKRVLTAEISTQTESVIIVDSEQNTTTNYLSSSTRTTPSGDENSTQHADSITVMTRMEPSDNLASRNGEERTETTMKSEQVNKTRPNVSHVRPRYMDIFSAKSASNDTKSTPQSATKTKRSKSDTRSPYVEVKNVQHHKSKWSVIRNILPKYLDYFKGSKSSSSNDVDNSRTSKGRETNTKSNELSSAQKNSRNLSHTDDTPVDSNLVLDDLGNVDQNLNDNNVNVTSLKGVRKTPQNLKRPKPRYLDHFNQSNKSNDNNCDSGSKIAETSLSNIRADAQATYVGSTRNGNTNPSDKDRKPNLIRVSSGYIVNDSNIHGHNDISKGRSRGSGKRGRRTGTGNSNSSKNSVSVISLEDMDPRNYIVPLWK